MYYFDNEDNFSTCSTDSFDFSHLKFKEEFIYHLTDDYVYNIMQFLDVSYLLHVSKVCKKWQVLAESVMNNTVDALFPGFLAQQPLQNIPINQWHTKPSLDEMEVVEKWVDTEENHGHSTFTGFCDDDKMCEDNFDDTLDADALDDFDNDAVEEDQVHEELLASTALKEGDDTYKNNNSNVPNVNSSNQQVGFKSSKDLFSEKSKIQKK